MAGISPECPFDCIVVTAANERQARSYDAELQRRQQRGILPFTALLVSVADPKGSRVGSGGGTLNALVHAVERLRAAQNAGGDGSAAGGKTNCGEWRILCIHSGGDSQRSPTQSVCGKAWSALNCVGPGGHLMAPIDLLCFRLFRLCRHCPAGTFVVASCDVLLLLPDDVDLDVLPRPNNGVWGLAIAADAKYGPHHGVYVVDGGTGDDEGGNVDDRLASAGERGGTVKKFYQKASLETLRAARALLPGNRVLVDSGVVGFGAQETSALLSLCKMQPFDGCIGAEGAESFQFDLYSDVLYALGGVCSWEEYFTMASSDSNAARMLHARELLWEALSGTRFGAVVVPSAQFAHLGTTAELSAAQTGTDERLDDFTRSFELVRAANSHGTRAGMVAINSVLGAQGCVGENAVVEHTVLSGVWSVGPGALVSGIRSPTPREFHVAADFVVQQIFFDEEMSIVAPRLQANQMDSHCTRSSAGGSYVFLVFGMHDPVKKHYADTAARLCGVAWSSILERLGATPKHIWPSDVDEANRCLWNARLYPVCDSACRASQLPPLLLQSAAIGTPISATLAEHWRVSRRRSMRDILAEASPSAEFAWRQAVHEDVMRYGVDVPRPIIPASCAATAAKKRHADFRWDVVCITARVPAHAEAYKRELKRHSPPSLLATLILAVGDPGDRDGVPSSKRVGSGGATLNAILLVAEHLSALAGDNNVDMNILHGKRVLVLHVGGALQRVPAFSRLPTPPQRITGASQGGDDIPSKTSRCRALSTIDLLLKGLSTLAWRCPPGLFVVSSEDSFAHLGEGFCERFVRTACRGRTSTDSGDDPRGNRNAEDCNGCVGSSGTATVIAEAATPESCRDHGVYELGASGDVRRVLYQAPLEELRRVRLEAAPQSGHGDAGGDDSRGCSSGDDGDVLGGQGACLVAKVCGVAFFDDVAASRLLFLAFDPLFEACSYLGIDNGSQPCGFSLYLDVLASMGKDVSLEEFERSTSIKGQVPVETAVRSKLWRHLHKQVDLCTVVTESNDPSQYAFVRSTRDYVRLVKSSLSKEPSTGTFPGDTGSLGLQAHVEHEGKCDVVGACVGGEYSSISHSACIVNSLLKECTVASGAVVESSHMEGCSIGLGAVCSGLKRVSNLQVPAGLVLQQVSLIRADVAPALPVMSPGQLSVGWEGSSGDREGSSCHPTFFVLTTCLNDDEERQNDCDGTFLGASWAEFLRSTGISAEDLWGSSADSKHYGTLRGANLFPVVQDIRLESIGLLWVEYAEACHAAPATSHTPLVDAWRGKWLQSWRASPRMSFAEAMAVADVAAEFDWQDTVAAERNVLEAKSLLLHNRDAPLRHIIADEFRRGRWGLLDVFDSVASAEDTPLDVAARTLAQIAELLAMYGGTEGGLRSGTGRNPRWRVALNNLRKCDVGSRRAAVLEMRNLRSKWMSEGSVALIRAARHYEAAAQVLIGVAVSTAEAFVHVSLPREPRVPVPSQWIIVEAPARIDLAGGWTDTPPICYEHGGAVLNLALKVDGRRPIGAKALRLSERFDLVFEIGAEPVEGGMEALHSSTTTCRVLTDLEGYDAPGSPAALLKAAVLCCGLASVAAGAPSLEDQLREAGGGLHVVSWSHLPQGSGLGTSSILAAVVMKAILVAMNRDMDNDSLIHAVLKLEQMLTTGGGWQDQVGGVFGGAKLARSASRLPLQVVSEVLPLCPEFVAELKARMVLVFTGRPRLAKYILQNVIRQWYGRMPEICTTVRGLVSNAEAAAAAIKASDLPLLGTCLDTYWSQKRMMAQGSEPQAIEALRRRLQPGLLGFSLAGAGGGGFAMLLVRADRNGGEWVRGELSGCLGLEGATVHAAEVDFEGMTVSC